MDLTSQTEEALGWAAEGERLAVEPTDVSFKDAATFVASMTPVIGDAMAAKDVYDELQKDEPNYYLAGALGGAALVGLIPGLGDAAAKAIKTGAKEVFDVAKRVEVDPNAMGSMGGNIRLKPTTVEPKKTVKAYKLFRTDPKQPGKLFPLFVDAKTPVETDMWVNAKAGDIGGKGKVKSKIGPLAYRPGWHAGDLPIATHIGGKVDPKTGKRVVDRKFQPNVREDNQVWAEVEMADDVDWQAIANSRAVMTKKGKPNPRTAHITDQLPSGGNYRYKTNSNMTGEWIIGGEMKVNRVLSRDEVNSINKAAGVKDLPTLDELNKGYSKGGVVMDDYQYAEMIQGGEDQTVKAFALGGLADEVDPVSGNEIPLGSTAEEVRDDIPAQLSEGEYVVPADVVKFFGVKFFEDLRTQAKQGFQDMEANGRIGGEPIGGMEMGGDELPFDISELQVVDDGQPEQPMMNEGGLMTGYADGGSVANMTVPDFLKDYIDKQKETGGIYYDTYMSPEGTPMVFAFRNGEAINPIPAGFVLQSDYMAPAAATASVAPQTNVDTSDANSPIDIDISKVGTDEDEDTTGSDVDWSKASVEDFKSAQDSLLSKILPGVAGGASLLGPLGVAASIGIKGSATRKRNDMIRGITERLSGMSNTDSDYSELKKIETSLLANRTKANKDTNLGIIESSGIYGGQSNITENLKDVDESGKVSFGDTWLGDALGFDKDGFGVQGAGLAASVGGDRREEDSASYRALEQVAANKARENKEVEAAIAAASKAVTPASTPSNTSSSGGIGRFSPVGGTDAGEGFSWEKKEGTNALTRTYTG